MIIWGKEGTPERIRTSDLLIRSQSLYPAELRAHKEALNIPQSRVIFNGMPETSEYLNGVPRWIQSAWAR